MDPEILGETLDAFADHQTAIKLRRQIQPLKGVRGVAHGDIARVAAAAWAEGPVVLPRDERDLTRLFGAAHEDGLVAIGLLAAAAPEAPEEALDIAFDWLGRVDDTMTADAIGWLVLGPAIAVSGQRADALQRLRESGHVEARRAAVMAALAWLPIPITGPSAAPLRERVGMKTVQFVDAALDDDVAWVMEAFLHDMAPRVLKALRRVAIEWGSASPEAAASWLEGVRGGVPKMLREPATKAINKARRQAARAER